MHAQDLLDRTKNLLSNGETNLTTDDVEWIKSLTEEQAKNVTHRAKLFKVGHDYFHERHGHGKVVGVTDDYVITMDFPDGKQEFHMAEHRRLRLVIQDADNHTAETLFKLADADCTGSITLEEFTFIHAMLKESSEKHSRLFAEKEKADKAHKSLASSLGKKVKVARAWMCAVIVFIIILLGLFACVTYGFFKEFITTGESNGFMAGGNGYVLKTSPALFALPLIVAPVLPWEQLKEVGSLTVSYYDPLNSDFQDQKVKASVSIVNVVYVNSTAVQFDATSGHRVKAIRVWNGEALVVFDDGTTASACAADVRCSALTSTDGEKVAEQTELAYEVLAEMGFTQNLVADASGRRSLDEGTCAVARTWCADGFLGDRGTVCCAGTCGQCGGTGCGKKEGGRTQCCSGNVKRQFRFCESFEDTVCTVPPPPPPMPPPPPQEPPPPLAPPSPRVPTQVSATWLEFKAARDAGDLTTAPVLDFSFAGYNHGESGIPRATGQIFDVTTYGAVPDDGKDDRPAVKQAIQAASAAGGGVVFFPSGRFLLSEEEHVEETMTITSANIVIKGSGSGGPTETILDVKYTPSPANPGAEFMWGQKTKALFNFDRTGFKSRRVTNVTLDARKGAFVLTVGDTSEIYSGDQIALTMKNPAATPQLLSGLTVDEGWTALSDGMQVRERHQVSEVLDGTHIKLVEPLMCDIYAVHGWNVALDGLTPGWGVEDLHLNGGWEVGSKFLHHNTWLADLGWKMISFKYGMQPYVRRVRITEVTGKPVTFENCFGGSCILTAIEGSQGHSSFTAKTFSYGTLFAFTWDDAQFHGHAASVGAVGTVITNSKVSNRGLDWHGVTAAT